MEIITAIGNFIEGLFTHAHLSSIVAGLLLSIGFTQLAKYPLRLLFHRKGLDPDSKLTPEIEVEFHRWVTRLIAVVAGIIGAFATWPDGSLTYRLVWSTATGLAAPAIYSIAVHFWPWLGDKASADRAIPPP